MNKSLQFSINMYQLACKDSFAEFMIQKPSAFGQKWSMVNGQWQIAKAESEGGSRG